MNQHFWTLGLLTAIFSLIGACSSSEQAGTASEGESFVYDYVQDSSLALVALGNSGAARVHSEIAYQAGSQNLGKLGLFKPIELKGSLYGLPACDAPRLSLPWTESAGNQGQSISSGKGYNSDTGFAWQWRKRESIILNSNCQMSTTRKASP